MAVFIHITPKEVNQKHNEYISRGHLNVLRSKSLCNNEFASKRKYIIKTYLITHIPHGGHPNLLGFITTKSLTQAGLI